jgi:hypothetical protein
MLMSCHQTVAEKRNTEIVNRPFDNVEVNIWERQAQAKISLVRM